MANPQCRSQHGKDIDMKMDIIRKKKWFGRTHVGVNQLFPISHLLTHLNGTAIMSSKKAGHTRQQISALLEI